MKVRSKRKEKNQTELSLELAGRVLETIGVVKFNGALIRALTETYTRIPYGEFSGKFQLLKAIVRYVDLLDLNTEFYAETAMSAFEWGLIIDPGADSRAIFDMIKNYVDVVENSKLQSIYDYECFEEAVKFINQADDNEKYQYVVHNLYECGYSQFFDAWLEALLKLENEIYNDAAFIGWLKGESSTINEAYRNMKSCKAFIDFINAKLSFLEFNRIAHANLHVVSQAYTEYKKQKYCIPAKGE